jgi:arsenate reductase
MIMKRVLFLCTGNSARNQMSETLLRDLGGDQFEVYSAGTHPSSEVNPFAIQVLKEIGVSVEGLHTKKVNQFSSQPFDLVVTVCDNARQECPFFPNAKEMRHWSLEDPASFEGTYEETLIVFREIRDEIMKKIKTQILEQKS